VSALDDVLEALVDVEEDRLGRHEHEGGVLGLAGDEVAVGDVLDVLHRIAPELRFRRDASFEEAERIDTLLKSPRVKRDIEPED